MPTPYERASWVRKSGGFKPPETRLTPNQPRRQDNSAPLTEKNGYNDDLPGDLFQHVRRGGMRAASDGGAYLSGVGTGAAPSPGGPSGIRVPARPHPPARRTSALWPLPGPSELQGPGEPRVLPVAVLGAVRMSSLYLQSAEFSISSIQTCSRLIRNWCSRVVGSSGSSRAVPGGIVALNELRPCPGAETPIETRPGNPDKLASLLHLSHLAWLLAHVAKRCRTLHATGPGGSSNQSTWIALLAATQTGFRRGGAGRRADAPTDHERSHADPGSTATCADGRGRPLLLPRRARGLPSPTPPDNPYGSRVEKKTHGRVLVTDVGLGLVLTAPRAAHVSTAVRGLCRDPLVVRVRSAQQRRVQPRFGHDDLLGPGPVRGAVLAHPGPVASHRRDRCESSRRVVPWRCWRRKRPHRVQRR